MNPYRIEVYTPADQWWRSWGTFATQAAARDALAVASAELDGRRFRIVDRFTGHPVPERPAESKGAAA